MQCYDYSQLAIILSCCFAVGFAIRPVAMQLFGIIIRQISIRHANASTMIAATIIVRGDRDTVVRKLRGLALFTKDFDGEFALNAIEIADMIETQTNDNRD